MDEANFKALVVRICREGVTGDVSPETLSGMQALVSELVRQALGGDLPAAYLKAAEKKDDAYLTQKEAAALAGVPESTIRDWQAAGRISGNSNERVSRVELRRLLIEGPARAPHVARPDAAPVAWDVKRAAKFLSISPKTLYRLSAQGTVPSLKVGGALRFDPDALATWRAAQQGGGR